MTCSVFQCFLFHLYAGVRAGGGIGDEIEPPDGDPYQNYRILFDITFFFFVIVILLAIIQGKLPIKQTTFSGTHNHWLELRSTNYIAHIKYIG